MIIKTFSLHGALRGHLALNRGWLYWRMQLDNAVLQVTPPFGARLLILRDNHFLLLEA